MNLTKQQCRARIKEIFPLLQKSDPAAIRERNKLQAHMRKLDEPYEGKRLVLTMPHLAVYIGELLHSVKNEMNGHLETRKQIHARAEKKHGGEIKMGTFLNFFTYRWHHYFTKEIEATAAGRGNGKKPAFYKAIHTDAEVTL